MVRLYLTLFGGFEARLEGGALLSLPTRKGQALLAYLAVPLGQAHLRDKLAALLWGDTPDEQARRSLRQALFTLRKALGRAGPTLLLTDGETLALNPEGVEVDVARFEQAVEEGTAAALERAAMLYRGDLLAGLAVNEAPFEEWLTAERERLRELAVEGLAKILAHQRQTGATEAAVKTALRLLALDPLQEPVHRTLMRLYSGLGRRGAALRQYQHCVAVVQRELGTEPEPETKQLYQAILRKRPAALFADAPTVPTAPPFRPLPDRVLTETPIRETELIGRERQLAQLCQALDDVWRGSGQVVAVLGEAGIGKSRLGEELAAEAIHREGLVLLGRCYESEQILPFGPWADAFRKSQVIRDAQLLAGLGPGWLAELARLFPELGDPERQPAPDAADPLRLFQAVGQLLAHLATGQPLVLVLEDLHWADDMSLRLLSFLGRRLKEWRVLIVGTAREEELPSAPMLRHVLEELKREQRLLELPLSPLSHGETVTLVRALARAGTQQLALTQLGDQMWRASEGNPFIIVETMRSLQEGRAPLASGLRLPERIHELIAGRLERVSDRSRDLVAAAAVIGRECDFPLLQRASGLTDREAAEGIEELVRRRVLRGVGERFDFTHDQIREVAYGHLLPPRRKLLHRLVAKALEDLYAGNLEPHYGALGVHYREAEVWGQAVEYLTRFAETAARTYADVEAVTALQEALGYVERLPAEQRDARFLDLVLRQANLFFFLGRFAETVDLLLRQQERLEHLASAELTGPYYFLLAQAYSVLGDRERSASSARRAIKAARLCGDDVTRGRTHYVLAREAYWLGQPRQGIEHGHQAIALLGQTSERYSLAMAHWWVGRNHGFIGEFDKALESAARALSIAEMTGDRRLQSHITWTIGDLHALRGDWERGIEICERALALSPDPLNIANASGHLGSAYLEKGDPAHAVPLLQQSARQFSEIAPAGQARGWFTMQLGEAYLLNGEPEQARELTDQGLDILETAGYRRGIAWARRTLGRIAVANHAYSEAEDQFNRALATFVAISALFEAGRTHLALADLAQVQGNLPGAGVHLSEAHTMFTALGVHGYAERTREVAKTLGVSLLERPAGLIAD